MAAFDRQPLSEFDSLSDAGNRWPQGLWLDATHAYVSDRVDRKIYAYLRTTRAHDPSRDFDTLQDAGNTAPAGIWSDGSIMYVADQAAGKVFAYDFQTKLRLSARDVTMEEVGDLPSILGGIWSNGRVMYVVYTNQARVLVYDLTNGTRVLALEFTREDIPTAIDNLWGVFSNDTIVWLGDVHEKNLYAYDRRSKDRRPELDFETIQARRSELDYPAGGWRRLLPQEFPEPIRDPDTGELVRIGQVTGFVIRAGGAGYQPGSTSLVIEGGGGSGATARATFSNGVITGIAVGNAGEGYSSTAPPAVTITDAGGGSGAVARAVVVSGAVSKIIVELGGSGYSNATAVTIAAPTGGTVTATAGAITRESGVITGVTLLTPGAGYTSAPTVRITGTSTTEASIEATFAEITPAPTPVPAEYEQRRTTIRNQQTNLYAQDTRFSPAGIAVNGSVYYGLDRRCFVSATFRNGIFVPGEAIRWASVLRYSSRTIARDMTNDGRTIYVLMTDGNRSSVARFLRGVPQRTDPTEDPLGWRVMNILYPDMVFTAIAWDGESILLAEEQTKTIYAITNNADDPGKRIPGTVIKGASPNIDIRAMTHDGQSLMLLDADTKGVYGFTDGRRDVAKDVPPASLLSADPNIAPQGVTYNDGTVWVLSDYRASDLGGAAYAFKSILRAERRDAALDLGDTLVSTAASDIEPSGIAIDDDDDALVLDKQNKAIRAFNFTRSRSAYALGADLGDASFRVSGSAPERVTVGQVGNDGTRYYVVDTAQSRILAVTIATQTRAAAWDLGEGVLRAGLVTYGYTGNLTISGIAWDGSALWVLFADASAAVGFVRSGNSWVPSTTKRFRLTGVAHPLGIAWTGTRLLIGDTTGGKVRGFLTTGARDTSLDLAFISYLALDTDFSLGGIAVIGTTHLLALDANGPHVYGFTLTGTRAAEYDIDETTIRESSAIFWPSGITYHAVTNPTVAIGNSFNASVITYSWNAPVAAARVTAKDVASSVLTGALATINPTGLAWDGEHYLVAHDEDQGSRIFAFTKTARHTAKDIATSVLGTSTRIGGLDFKDGRLYVLDRAARMVKAFENGARASGYDLRAATIQAVTPALVGEGVAWLGDVLYVLDGSADVAYAFRQSVSGGRASYAHQPINDLSARLLRSALAGIAPRGLAGRGEALLVADEAGGIYGFDPAEEAPAPFIEVDVPQGFHAASGTMYLVGAGAQEKVFAFEMPSTPQRPQFPRIAAEPLLLPIGTVIDPIRVPDAIGNPQPTYTAAGLPSGLQLNPGNTITGTVTGAAATGTIVVTASSPYGTDTYQIPWRTQAHVPVSFSESDPFVIPTFIVGSPVNYTLPRANGFPLPTYSYTGSIPDMTINVANRKMSGTPTTPATNQSGIRWTARQPDGTEASILLVYTFHPAPTSGTIPASWIPQVKSVSVNWTRGRPIVPQSFGFIAGNPRPAVTAVGLPAGIMFDSNYATDSIGQQIGQRLSGTPLQAGTGQIQLIVDNGLAQDTFTINYVIVESNIPRAPLWNTPGPNIQWVTGSTISYMLEAADLANPAPVYTVEGLPDGVLFDPDTLLLTGTVRHEGAGTIRLTATNPSGSATRLYTWTVGFEPPNWVQEQLPAVVWVANRIITPITVPEA